MSGPYLVAEETSCVHEEIESTSGKLVHRVGHTFSGEQSHLPDAERRTQKTRMELVEQTHKKRHPRQDRTGTHSSRFRDTRADTLHAWNRY